MIGSAAGILFVAFWIVGKTPERWATRTPDNVHSYAVRYKGGTDWFFAARLGWFIDHGLWIFFALLAVAVLHDEFSHRRTSR
jgi:hypothetical protein